jgi:hypothetical protein
VHFQYEPLLPGDPDWDTLVVQNPMFLSAFPHRSKQDPALISWTPTTDYGFQDRRVVGKPGRMLSSMWKMDERSVADFVNRINIDKAPLDFKLAESADDIMYVYQVGPHSCMSKMFKAHLNPLRAYVTPALRVAYAEQEKSSRITARAIVRMDTTPPQYTRIYGNEFALRKMLHERGFVFAENGLAGVQLGEPAVTLHESDNCFIHLPYLDPPAQTVLMDIEAHTLVVAPAGIHRVPNSKTQVLISALDQHGNVRLGYNVLKAWSARNPELLAPPLRIRTLTSTLDDLFDHYELDDEGDIMCASCEEWTSTDDVHPSIDRQPICEDCINDHHVFAMQTSGNRVYVNGDDSRVTWVECVDDYCVGCSPDEVFEVCMDMESDEWIRRDDASYSEVMGGYLYHEVATQVFFADPNSDSDYVSEHWLQENQGMLLFSWARRPPNQYPTDYPDIFITEEGRFNEQRQALLAQAAGTDRENSEERIFQSCDELVAELTALVARTADGSTLSPDWDTIGSPARSLFHTVTAYVPGWVKALVRERLRAMEAGARSVQPRAAVR